MNNNRPQRIQDRPTKRIEVSSPTVKRMFAEADIAEELARVDFTCNVRAVAREIAASLAVMW